MVLQYIVVAIAVTLSLLYAFFRVRKMLTKRSHGDSCAGCALANQCEQRH